VVRQISSQAHPDLLVLERTENESGNLRSVITVDEVRRTVSFFGSTAGAGGWRVCIVDAADELQYPQASNALLKVLEEPPARALFLLVSHAPGRLLATIRSRCRRLDLRPLDQTDVARAVAAATGRNLEEPEIRAAAAAAEGSVARALNYLDGPALALRRRVMGLLEALPQRDPGALHALGDVLATADNGAFAAFADTVRDWLSQRLDVRPQPPSVLDRVAEAWDKANQAMHDAEVFNLDRKPLVFAVFALLAELPTLPGARTVDTNRLPR
jgi:DNA polymerase-3 subunit delta'